MQNKRKRKDKEPISIVKNGDVANYISLLPEAMRYKGDHRLGEIEIVTSPNEIVRIKSALQKQLRQARLTKSSSILGIVYRDEYILIIRDPVKFPSGANGTYIRIIEQTALNGATGVVILPICMGRFYFRKVFRHATRAWELEVPRGFRSKGSSAKEAVKQEIAEELGLRIKKIIELGQIKANTGLFAGAAQSFIVEVAPGIPRPAPELTEAFGDIVRLTSKQVVEKICSGEITDGFTLSVLQQAQAHKLIDIFSKRF